MTPVFIPFSLSLPHPQIEVGCLSCARTSTILAQPALPLPLIESPLCPRCPLLPAAVEVAHRFIPALPTCPFSPAGLANPPESFKTCSVWNLTVSASFVTFLYCPDLVNTLIPLLFSSPFSSLSCDCVSPTLGS